ncbi:MAG: putative RNA methyltransferase [Gammaproteobacteria bacterium]
MPQLICPLCQDPLLPAGNTWACSRRHSFDVAREGYVNLLPVQQRKSRAPGDNPDMVRARRAFLEAGYYQPLREVIVEEVARLAPASLLDIGCGEGWYTAALADVCADVTGLDIARPAIQRAAKRDRRVTWLVAGSAHLPLADASVDLACSLFSPLPVAELHRVLRPGGHLLLATPGADHLLALRRALFETVLPHRPEKFAGVLAEAFSLASVHEVRFPLHLDAAALQDLLAMTPYAWRATAERRAALAGSTAFADEAVVSVQVFTRLDRLPSTSESDETLPAD